MKKTASVGFGAMTLAALAFAAKDPVIMRVAGVDVPKSEFEYLYNKNSQQQVNPQTLDEYVEMFKLYKMKVADAKAEGIDTTAAFIKEMETYRHDLATPYLADSTYINSLVHDAWERSKQEAEARHIMLFKTRDNAQNAALRQRADSLAAVLKNGGNFEALASEYSMDRGSKSRGGYMGWIVAGSYPLAFEDVAFTLPEGEISQVVESPVGYHILKGGKKRPARGKVQVQHILKLTQGKSEQEQEKAKHDIDSLYNLVKASPESFTELATANSEDRGSARQGGFLPYFGAGEMVAEFDSVSFALPDGEISAPFKTSYGYHIVKRIKGEQIAPLENVKSKVVAKINNPQDPRHRLVRRHQNAVLAKKFKGSLNTKCVEALEADARQSGIDSLFVAKYTSSPVEIFNVGSKKYTTAGFISDLTGTTVPAGDAASEVLANHIEAHFNSTLVNAAEDELLKTEPDYRNLLREYIDGSLLYEVSVQKVWDRAAKDSEGLEEFFNRNRSNYTWTEPHAKGFLVQVSNDTVAQEVRERAAGLSNAEMVKTIREEFKGKALIDKVLVSKGTNGMVDNILFGGPEVTPAKSKYPVYFMINPRVITAPEEASDVKGLVTSDYQAEFQTNWENELRNKYPASVNEKVLRTVRKK